MNAQNKEYSACEDEINLYDYWKVIIKRRKLIIWLFLISVISTAVINLLTPKVYKGEAALRIMARNIKGEEVIKGVEVIDILGRLDHEKIGMIFHKKNNSVGNLKITANKNSTDRFDIIIESRRAEDISALITEFAEYINNYPPIKNLLEQERGKIKKQIDNLSVLIDQQAEFAENYEKLLRKGRLSSILLNPVDLKQKIFDMEAQKRSLEEILDNFRIEINTSSVSMNPVRPTTKRNIILAGTLGLFAGIFLAMLMEYLEKTRQTKKQNT